MSESKEDTDPDWLDPDVDPDEAPELTDEIWDRAEIAIGGKVIRPATGTLTRAFTPDEIRARRGRPPLGEAAKVQQSLRLSREVLDHFRATGRGWQARIDEVLRRHVEEATGAARRVAEEQEEFRGEEGGGDRTDGSGSPLRS
ncbi:MAG TPA: BrnA antitoxin family protein [Allosphingosinicella sp.]|nr:BrnA antitoxin family protein [Allosphingosinicella sp.]